MLLPMRRVSKKLFYGPGSPKIGLKIGQTRKKGLTFANNSKKLPVTENGRNNFSSDHILDQLVILEQ